MKQQMHRLLTPNNKKQKIILWLLMGLLLILITNVVFAAPVNQPDPSSFIDTSKGFFHFFEGVKYVIADVLGDPALNHMALVFWRVFAAVGLILLMVRYAMNGISFEEVFTFVFVVLFTRALMNQYDLITTAFWGWSEGFSSHLQLAVTGNGDLFWLARYIWNAFTATSFGMTSILHPMYLVTIILLELIAALLCVLGAFATVWGLWGYALSKMLGFMFVPFMLFEKMSWLFDGWFRFFLGFLLYNVIARANLILVVVALQEFFNLPSKTIPIHEAMSFHLYTITDAVGILCFLLLSIIGLLSTSRFVAHIVGGNSFSVTSGLRQMAASIGAAVSVFL